MFRGSDVKDISVAEEKENTKPEPPQVPDDPAILGVSDFTFSILPSFCCIVRPFHVHTCRGRAIDHMMNYLGCKLTDLFRIAQTIYVDLSVAFLLI